MSYPALESPIAWSSRLMFRPVAGSSLSPPRPRSPPSLSASISLPNASHTSPPKFSDKILLPQSVLQSLLDQSGPSHLLPSPLTFRITNPLTRQFTHVGVREFSADEGTCLIPSVIASRIDLKEGQPINIKLVELPKATFLSLEIAESNELDTNQNSYHDVDDWKALLEAQLQSGYTALTKNDTLYISNPSNPSRHYKGLVKELKPDDAVLIINTDIDLDIVPPLDSQLPSTVSAKGKFPNSPPRIATPGSHIREPLTIELSELANKPQELVIAEISPLNPQINFILKNWPRKNSLKTTISIPQDENETFDPNFLNFYISPAEFASSSVSFLWSTLKTTDPRDKSLTLLPNDPFLPSLHNDQSTSLYGTLSIPSSEKYGNQTFKNIKITFSEDVVTIDEDGDSPMDSTNDLDYTCCDNCLQKVPKRSYQLHLNFCQRNNVACKKGCNQLFSRREGGIPSSHWHCEVCSASNHPLVIYGNTESSYHLHNHQFHTQLTCESCGSEEQFSDMLSLARHKATTCPSKLHICRFCHLKLPQEETSPVDILVGFTGHESFCGGRTTDCDVCHKAVRLRDLSSHLQIHEFQRLTNKPPSRLCSNINCSRIIPDNEYFDTTGTSLFSPIDIQGRTEKQPYGLCKICYGPLYNSAYDPTGAKLLSRVERRYVIQMTRGCGKSFCNNQKACASNMSTKLKMPEVMKLARELMALKPDSELEEGQGKRFKEVFFCVDETTTKRKMFVDLISDVEQLYSKEWAAKAIDIAKGKESEARKWLESNAIKLSEQ